MQPLSGRLDPAVVSYASADSEAKRTTHSTRAGVAALSPLQEGLRQAMRVGAVLSLGALRTPDQYRTLAVTTGVGGAVLAAWALWKGAGAAAAPSHVAPRGPHPRPPPPPLASSRTRVLMARVRRARRLI